MNVNAFMMSYYNTYNMLHVYFQESSLYFMKRSDIVGMNLRV